MSIIEKMRNSGNKILENEAKDFAVWSKLKHTKQDFETFLNYNIAEINFKTVNGEQRTIICTSNTTLIRLFALKKSEDKKKFKSSISSGIKTKDKMSIDTWDLINNKRKTISLNSWAIQNFISITPENILLLDKLITDFLHK